MQEASNYKPSNCISTKLTVVGSPGQKKKLLDQKATNHLISHLLVVHSPPFVHFIVTHNIVTYFALYTMFFSYQVLKDNAYIFFSEYNSNYCLKCEFCFIMHD